MFGRGLRTFILLTCQIFVRINSARNFNAFSDVFWLSFRLDTAHFFAIVLLVGLKYGDDKDDTAMTRSLPILQLIWQQHNQRSNDSSYRKFVTFLFLLYCSIHFFPPTDEIRNLVIICEVGKRLYYRCIKLWKQSLTSTRNSLGKIGDRWDFRMIICTFE